MAEYRWLESTFSLGKFKSLSHEEKKHVHDDEPPKTKKSSSDIQESQTNHGLYSCPENGCTRVFQRHSAITKHLSSEKCIRSLEKQGQNNFNSLMYIHVQHLASFCRICGDEIEDHKGKIDTNHFVSEIHQIWKDLMLLDSPNVHPPPKKNQRKKANFKCK